MVEGVSQDGVGSGRACAPWSNVPSSPGSDGTVMSRDWQQVAVRIRSIVEAALGSDLDDLDRERLLRTVEDALRRCSERGAVEEQGIVGQSVGERRLAGTDRCGTADPHDESDEVAERGCSHPAEQLGEAGPTVKYEAESQETVAIDGREGEAPHPHGTSLLGGSSDMDSVDKVSELGTPPPAPHLREAHDLNLASQGAMTESTAFDELAAGKRTTFTFEDAATFTLEDTEALARRMMRTVQAKVAREEVARAHEALGETAGLMRRSAAALLAAEDLDHKAIDRTEGGVAAANVRESDNPGLSDDERCLVLEDWDTDQPVPRVAYRRHLYRRLRGGAGVGAAHGPRPASSPAPTAMVCGMGRSNISPDERVEASMTRGPGASLSTGGEALRPQVASTDCIGSSHLETRSFSSPAPLELLSFDGLSNAIEAERRRASPATHTREQRDIVETLARVERRMAASPSARYGREAASFARLPSDAAEGATGAVVDEDISTPAEAGTGGVVPPEPGYHACASSFIDLFAPLATHDAAAFTAPDPDSVVSVLARMMHVEVGPAHLNPPPDGKTWVDSGPAHLHALPSQERAAKCSTTSSARVLRQAGGLGQADGQHRRLSDVDSIDNPDRSFGSGRMPPPDTTHEQPETMPWIEIGRAPLCQESMDGGMEDTVPEEEIVGEDPRVIAERAASQLREMRAAARRVLASTTMREGAVSSPRVPPSTDGACSVNADVSSYFARLAAMRLPGAAASAAVEGRRTASELARMLRVELELNENLVITEREVAVMRNRHLAESRAEEATGRANIGEAFIVEQGASSRDWRQRQRLELEEMQEQLRRQRRAHAERCKELEQRLTVVSASVGSEETTTTRTLPSCVASLPAVDARQSPAHATESILSIAGPTEGPRTEAVSTASVGDLVESAPMKAFPAKAPCGSLELGTSKSCQVHGAAKAAEIAEHETSAASAPDGAGLDTSNIILASGSSDLMEAVRAAELDFVPQQRGSVVVATPAPAAGNVDMRIAGSGFRLVVEGPSHSALAAGPEGPSEASASSSAATPTATESTLHRGSVVRTHIGATAAGVSSIRDEEAPTDASFQLQYEVEVPSSVPEGGCFAAHIGGQIRLVEVPRNAREGLPPETPLRLAVSVAAPPMPPPPPPPQGLWIVEVPPHLRAGDSFTANVGGALMNVLVPEGASVAPQHGRYIEGMRYLESSTDDGRDKTKDYRRRRGGAPNWSTDWPQRLDSHGMHSTSDAGTLTRHKSSDEISSETSTSARSSLRPPPPGSIGPWERGVPSPILGVERALLALLLEERSAVWADRQGSAHSRLSSQVLSNITNLSAHPISARGDALMDASLDWSRKAERERALEMWRREDAAAAARAKAELRAAMRKERMRAKAARSAVARNLRRERERLAATFRGMAGVPPTVADSESEQDGTQQAESSSRVWPAPTAAASSEGDGQLLDASRFADSLVASMVSCIQQWQDEAERNRAAQAAAAALTATMQAGPGAVEMNAQTLHGSRVVQDADGDVPTSFVDNIGSAVATPLAVDDDKQSHQASAEASLEEAHLDASSGESLDLLGASRLQIGSLAASIVEESMLAGLAESADSIALSIVEESPILEASGLNGMPGGHDSVVDADSVGTESIAAESVAESAAGDLSIDMSASEIAGVDGISAALISSLIESGVLLSATGDYLGSAAASEIASAADETASYVTDIPEDSRAYDDSIVPDQVQDSVMHSGLGYGTLATSTASISEAVGACASARRASLCASSVCSLEAPPSELMSEFEEEPVELAAERLRLEELRAKLTAKKAEAVGVVATAIDSERHARARAAMAAEEVELLAQLEASEAVIAAGKRRIAAAGGVTSLLEEDSALRPVMSFNLTLDESIQSEVGAFATSALDPSGSESGIADEVDLAQASEDEVSDTEGGPVVDEIEESAAIGVRDSDANAFVVDASIMDEVCGVSKACMIGPSVTSVAIADTSIVNEIGEVSQAHGSEISMADMSIADELRGLAGSMQGGCSTSVADASVADEVSVALTVHGFGVSGSAEASHFDEGGGVIFSTGGVVVEASIANAVDAAQPRDSHNAPWSARVSRGDKAPRTFGESMAESLISEIGEASSSTTDASRLGLEPATGPAGLPIMARTPTAGTSVSRPPIDVDSPSDVASEVEDEDEDGIESHFELDSEAGIDRAAATDRAAASEALGLIDTGPDVASYPAQFSESEVAPAPSTAATREAVALVLGASDDEEEEIPEDESIAELSAAHLAELESRHAAAAAKEATEREQARRMASDRVAAQRATAEVQRLAAEKAREAQRSAAEKAREVQRLAAEKAASERAAAEKAAAKKAAAEMEAAEKAAAERAAAAKLAEDHRQADALTSSLAQRLIDDAIVSAARAIRAKAKHRSAPMPSLTSTVAPTEVGGPVVAVTPHASKKARLVLSSAVAFAAANTVGGGANAPASNAAATSGPLADALLEDLLQELGKEVLLGAKRGMAGASARSELAASPQAAVSSRGGSFIMGVPLASGRLPGPGSAAVSPAPSSLVTTLLSVAASPASPKSPRSPVSPTRPIPPAVLPAAPAVAGGASSKISDAMPLLPMLPHITLSRPVTFGISTAPGSLGPLPSGSLLVSSTGSHLAPLSSIRAPGRMPLTPANDRRAVRTVPSGSEPASAFIASLREEAHVRGEAGPRISRDALESALARLDRAAATPSASGGEAEHVRAWASLLWAAFNEAAGPDVGMSGVPSIASAVDDAPARLVSRQQEEAHARMVRQLTAVAGGAAIGISGGVPVGQVEQRAMSNADLAEMQAYARARRKVEEDGICAAVADTLLKRMLGEFVAELSDAGDAIAASG